MKQNHPCLIDRDLFKDVVDYDKLNDYQAFQMNRLFETLFKQPVRELKHCLLKEKQFHFSSNLNNYGYGILIGSQHDLVYLPFLEPDYCAEFQDCLRIAVFPTQVTAILEAADDIYIGTNKGNHNIFSFFSQHKKSILDYLGRPVRIDALVEYRKTILVKGKNVVCTLDGKNIISLTTQLTRGAIRGLIADREKLHLHIQSKGYPHKTNSIVNFDCDNGKFGVSELSFPGPDNQQLTTLSSEMGYITTAQRNVLQLDEIELKKTKLTNDKTYQAIQHLKSTKSEVELLVSITNTPDLYFFHITRKNGAMDVRIKPFMKSLTSSVSCLQPVTNRDFHEQLVSS